MTAGTVVITGGILATVILLCIIAVLCYCRLQVSAGAVPYLVMDLGSIAASQAKLLLQEGSQRGFLTCDGQGVEPLFPPVAAELRPFLLVQGDSPKVFLRLCSTCEFRCRLGWVCNTRWRLLFFFFFSPL